jgi:hypothetical protein
MESTHLCDKRLKDMLKCMGTTESICYRNHTNIALISAGTGVCSYVDWDFFVQLSEYYTPLKPAPLFLHPAHTYTYFSVTVTH